MRDKEYEKKYEAKRRERLMQSLQKASPKAVAAMEMSDHLRGAYMSAENNGTLEHFHHVERHEIMSLHSRKGGGSVSQSAENVIAMQKRIDELEHEIGLYEVDMLLIKCGRVDEVIQMRN